MSAVAMAGANTMAVAALAGGHGIAAASSALVQGMIAALCGALVSFSLGLIGGGGSILAVPLMLYVVGLRDPHLAIGTAALAVSINAFINLIPHARAGHVKWGAAVTFAISGVMGAMFGSSIGKLIDGHKLIVYFAFLMCFVAVLMLRPRGRPAVSTPVLATTSAVTNMPLQLCWKRLTGTGLGAGCLSGFFGIGGGFLVVPGLMFAGRLEIVNAIGTSLFAVGSFGMTTAVNYAIAGDVDWLIAGEFVAGGIVGGWLGARSASRLSARRGALNLVFSAMIVGVAAYILWRA
jgi:uncharacterized membrane protein YfcA